jgi:hypothetical protein
MKRRKWRPEQKALIVLEGLKGKPIGELCAPGAWSAARESPHGRLSSATWGARA